jgi:hypothetical protein
VTETPVAPRPVVDVLAELLTIEARLEGLGRRGAALRQELEGRARQQMATDGVAPTWRAKGLGLASFSDPQPKVTVKNAGAFAEWVAQRVPDYATAAVTVSADPDVLERALTALAEDEVPVLGVSVAVDPAWSKTFLEGCAAVDEPPTDEVFASDAAGPDNAGQRVDGLHLAPAAPGRLSVRLDPEAKARAVAEAADTVAGGILIAPLGELAAASSDVVLEHALVGALDARRCRVCDCTDDRACEGGCSWVEADLCSACVGAVDDAEGEPDDDDWHPPAVAAGWIDRIDETSLSSGAFQHSVDGPRPVDDAFAAPAAERTEAEVFDLPAGDRLEKLKVAELRVLLVDRHLPLGGNKGDLIERLRAWAKQQVPVST